MLSFHIISYIIIFLPLIACFLCLLVNFPRSNFFIFTLSSCAVIASSLALLIMLPDFKTHIVSNIHGGPISVAINYNIGFLSLYFISLVTFIQLITAIFYKNILGQSFNDESKKLFYALNLLNLFAINGIFTTGNIINLYVFIEIYSFTFYAISCSSRESSLNKLAFKYFYQGSIGSILILLGVLTIFINFGSSNFEEILSNISNLAQESQIITISLIAVIFFVGIILKFLPLWLYFDTIRSISFLSHFLSSRFLFTKVNIGFYLILKSLFFLFGSALIFKTLKIDVFILIFAFLLIFYSNIKILKSNNLRIITSYFCFTYLGFFLLSVAINSLDSVKSTILFISHYSLIGLLLLLICGYMSDNFRNCNIKNLSLLKRNSLIGGYCFKLIIPFICALPLTFLFLANWHLVSSLFKSYYLILILLPLSTTFFVFSYLSVKMMGYFYFDSNTKSKTPPLNNLQDNIYYIISFVILICVMLSFVVKPDVTLDIFRNLSLYLR